MYDLELGYLPGLRIELQSTFVGAAYLVGLGSISLMVHAYLASAGFFQLALAVLVRYTRSPFGLLVALAFASGILSALFLNDTIVLIFTLLTLSFTQVLGLNPMPYLFALAGATNIDSVTTVSGNPQNILTASLSGISYLAFGH